MKIEWDRQRAAFNLDRVEPKLFPKPTNYGFIPQTLDDDGDELDTLLITEEPVSTGVWMEANIIGVMNFEDGGDMDHKIILVPADDRHSGNSIKSLEDIPQRLKQQIEHHFTHYKDLVKPGTTKVLGWGGVDEAKKIISESIVRFRKS